MLDMSEALGFSPSTAKGKRRGGGERKGGGKKKAKKKRNEKEKEKEKKRQQPDWTPMQQMGKSLKQEIGGKKEVMKGNRRRSNHGAWTLESGSLN